MAKANKLSRYKPLHLAAVAFLILLVGFVGYFFGYDIGYEKSTKNKVPFRSHSISESLSSPQGTYQNETVGFEIQYPLDFHTRLFQPYQDEYHFEVDKQTLQPGERLGVDGGYEQDELSIRIEIKKENLTDLNEIINSSIEGNGNQVASKSPIEIDGVKGIQIRTTDNNKTIYLLHNGYRITIFRNPAVSDLEEQYTEMVSSIRLKVPQLIH